MGVERGDKAGEGGAAPFKGARDVRYTMWVSMLGMWGCRVVAGYTLGIVLGMGVIGVWLGMVLDWDIIDDARRCQSLFSIK